MLQVNVNVSRKNWLSHYQLHNYVTALHISQKVKDKNDEGAPKKHIRFGFSRSHSKQHVSTESPIAKSYLATLIWYHGCASKPAPVTRSLLPLLSLTCLVLPNPFAAGKSDGDPLFYSLTTLSNWLYDKVPILWRHPRGTNTGALTCLSFGSLPNFTALSNFVTHSPLCLTRSTTSQLTSSEYPGDILVATILAPCLSFTK